ncbi:bifunctional protein-serine/threonine kinase/phosphatase [Candidatus Marithrix sp. Canyon 246]|uniref:bifunctional protein-serine/threonine kinase/phosphatase n=1 Tax=Candidatus Marithrix sp. Canyon 246 TaxID=1827136 RepID=UPI000849ED1B|nr:bifunctional protein-serine/threonine kinase/phosphatase [Candidatus Marithrix sp. Canyon 246]
MLKQISITIGQYSEAGRKQINQDAFGVFSPPEPLLSTKGIVAVIADGVSCSEAGDQASKAAVENFLNDYFSTPESWTVKTAGQKILTAMNSWLYGQGYHLYGTNKGLITTLSALVIKSTKAYLFHIGDSRIYRLREGKLKCLTQDHRIQVSKDKQYLSRALGIELHLKIDYRELAVEEGDQFIFVTDGVYEYVTDNFILESIIENDLNQACEKLSKLAFSNDSPDNLTCQIVRVDNLPTQDIDGFYQQLTELPFPPALDQGMILDGYKVIRELYASNRTQLYLAVDQETNKKLVLKTPSMNFEDDPAYIDLFLHEQWVGKRINHPHVMKVYEHKKHRKFLYSATEYIEGQTLRQWMNDHPKASLVETREIVNQIKNGLRAFHRMEMIHQDIKPENIMIDQDGTVKIIDFGSTKIAGLEEITTPLERISLLGTKNYTAPESLLGYSGSTQTDIFALGVITYEMLTGKLPYKNKLNYISASSIPIWVDNVLRKAVHPDPKKRYDTATEFIKALDKPTSSQSSFILDKSFWKRSAVISFMLNLILILLVLILLD